jgi:hypothetical protein
MALVVSPWGSAFGEPDRAALTRRRLGRTVRPMILTPARLISQPHVSVTDVVFILSIVYEKSKAWFISTDPCVPVGSCGRSLSGTATNKLATEKEAIRARNCNLFNGCS